jgi:hypothetical protein
LIETHTSLTYCWKVEPGGCAGDGVHPNNYKYGIIAEAIYNKMVEEGLN